ncbi:MAG: sulfatase-like hydrolase/transferase [Candidatus Lokiarchaeota archaeon]|nr:sulfatase-like hydrolase/transferase [Candidatus Lokiarchaeota archaeon]
MIKLSGRPNILFIMTDQQRADHLSCMGNEILKTPNIDSIAKNGTCFRRCYCSNPMCMPNRATIFTGKYPSIHGVRCNGINLTPTITTITEKLANNDYYTKAIGKLHFQFYGKLYPGRYKSAESIMGWMFKKRKKNVPLPYYGFEDVDITVGHGDIVLGDYMNWLEEVAPKYAKKLLRRPEYMSRLYYETPIPEEYYSTSYIAERAINFLEQYSSGSYGNNPFFLFCSFPDPHHPVCPPGKYKEMYKPEDSILPEDFNESGQIINHDFLGAHLDDPSRTDMFYKKIDEEDARNFIAATYGSVAMIDDGVGKILHNLRKLGLEENTMIIYTSDHGDLMADHGFVLKGPIHFNGVINVPLIWKLPQPNNKKNQFTDSLVSSIDIPKTILDLLGVENIRYMQGYNIDPILNNPKDKVRDYILIEDDDYEHSGKGISTSVRTLITEEYRLSIYRDFDDIGDLFNLNKDPREKNNLWNNQDFRPIRDKLTSKLLHKVMKVQSIELI